MENTDLLIVPDANTRERHLLNTKLDGRKLVSIVKIDDLVPIPGADRIITAHLGGWPSVVKNGEFVPGEMGLYFEADSFLNPEDERFGFLASGKIEWKGIEGIRLKSIKLKKQLSQGLLLPLALFPEVATADGNGNWIVKTEEGDVTLNRFADSQDPTYQLVNSINFTEAVGVIKWEKIERNSGGANLAGNSAGTFPSYLRKSDQPRVQGMVQEVFGYDPREVPMPADQLAGMPAEAIQSLVDAGRARWDGEVLTRMFPPTASRSTRYEATLKMDGSSMTAFKVLDGDAYRMGVCSRNLELKADDGENVGNAFVDTFNNKVRPIMELLDESFALQGEIVGPGIQGDYEKYGEKTGEYHFMIYNIFDIENQEFVLPATRHIIVDLLNILAEEAGLNIRLNHVPVLAFGETLGEMGITNIAEMLAFAEGDSVYHSVREGVVFKDMDNAFQFKAISNEYLLKTDS